MEKNTITENIKVIGGTRAKESLYFIVKSMRQYKHMGDVLLARENEKIADEMHGEETKKDLVLIRDAIIERNNILNGILKEMKLFGCDIPEARTWQYDVTKQLQAVVSFMRICTSKDIQELISAAM